MSCQRCHKDAVARVTAKCGDLFHFVWPGGREHRGAVLPHELIGLRDHNAYNDYVEFDYCLGCGQIQGEWPVKGGKKYVTKVKEARVRIGQGFLCFETVDANRAGTGYVRLIDENEEELVYWDQAEWREDPIGVMGAIMGAIQSLHAGMIPMVKAAKEE